MLMLEKETALKIAGIVSSSYYNEMLAFYQKAFQVSRKRENRQNPDAILRIQLDLAKAETKLWEALREGRTVAKTLRAKSSLTEQEKNDLKGTEKHIFIHEQLIRISRTICDGIAWRCLNYNRTFLTSAARGFGAGDIDVTSRDFQSEFLWAYRISKKLGSIVIVNDLTRFLRVGDLTEINTDAVFVHEIKKYGDEVKNMFTLKPKEGNVLSYQAKRLLELQRIALSNEALIEGQPVKTQKINVRVSSNIGKIKNLLRRSEQVLIASEDIEPFITVEVINFDAIGKRPNVDTELLKTLTRPKPRGMYLVHSNWDSFFSDERGNFLRAVPPYSVFPFDNRDCLKLMSGQFQVITTINIDGFKRELRRYGWDIRDTTEASLDKQLGEFDEAKKTMFTSKTPLYGQTPDEAGLFTVIRGPFQLAMTTMFYERLTMEYMTFKSLLALLEEMYRVAALRQKGDMYFPRFINEHELWN